MKLSSLILLLCPATLVLASPAISPPHLETRSTCTSWNYQKQMLQSFNVHRANHSASALVWDNALATAAANTAKNGAIGVHDNSGKGWGQNLYNWLSSNAADPSLQGSAAVDWWYNGEFSNYNTYGDKGILTNFPNNLFPSPAKPNTQYYHFTQTVWVGTKSVGCATASRPSGGLKGTYTVCNFSPSGNFVTSKTTWKENVLAPKGSPVVKILCPSGSV